MNVLTGHRVPAGVLVPAAYALGTLVAAIVGGAWWMTALGALPAAALLSVDRAPTRRALLVAVVVLAAAAGHVRLAAADARPPPRIATVTGNHVLVGVLRDNPSIDGVTARLDVDLETLDGEPASGAVRVTVRAPRAPLLAGDRLRVAGKVERPPAVADFDYAGYLRSRGVYAVARYPKRWERVGHRGAGLREPLLALRRWATGNIERALPEPAAALCAGVLVGERRTMPPALTEALRVTGTTHLVVVSGQNVALLLGSAIALLSAVMSRRHAAVLSLALLPPYVMLIGADPPVVRAAFMSVGIAAAQVTGRRTPGWIYLLDAGTAMLLLDPTLARDVAFQLSMSATAGVMLLPRPLGDLAAALPGGLAERSGPVLELAVTATAATLAVVPVQAAAFQSLSLIAIPANIAVAPIYDATVLVSMAAALLGWLEPCAELIWAAGRFVPGAFLATVAALARVPGGTVPVRAPLLAGIAWYAGLAGGVAWLAVHRPAAAGVEFGGGGVARTLALATLACGAWLAVLAPVDRAATLTVLDVGQGLAVLVRDGGRSVLFDTGPPDGTVMQALPRVGLGRRLDAIVISHSDADHSGGAAAILRRLDVGALLASRQTLDALGLAGRPIDIGDRIRLDARTTLDVISPPLVTGADEHATVNDEALVLLVTVGERRFLLAADIEAPAEDWLVRSGEDLHADVIVVPHHGSRTSSTPPFLAAVDPALAVISVGAHNTFGHPAPEVVTRYEAAGVRVDRTDQEGDVTVRTDGERLWVRTAR